jgi:hypothetical protein
MDSLDGVTSNFHHHDFYFILRNMLHGTCSFDGKAWQWRILIKHRKHES